MPTQMLGGIGSGLGGAIGSLFGQAPSTTTGTTNANTVSSSDASSSQSGGATSGGTTSTTPTLPDWYSSFLQSLVPQYTQQSYNASKPVVGQAQQANYIQGLNSSFGGAQQQLLSTLAKSGQLNSGAATQALTGLTLGKLGNIQSYLAGIPFQNAQFNQTYGNQLLGMGMNFKAPYGSTSTNNAFNNYFGNSNSNSNTTSNTTSQTMQKNSGSGLLGAIGI